MYRNSSPIRSNLDSDHRIEMIPVNRLLPSKNNARTHSKKQIRQIADSIEKFGFNNPVLIGDGNEIIAGHGRLAAAKQLGLGAVPAVRLSHLSPTERRAYILADNRLAQSAEWNHEILATELQGLIDLNFEIELTGFTTGEIDLILDEANQVPGEANEPKGQNPEPLPGPTVCQVGDLWVLGAHRLHCGAACDSGAYELLLEGDLSFVDLAIKHWQARTCKTATLTTSGQSFAEIEQTRLSTPPIAGDKPAAAARKGAR